ncbi:hypothetical protein BDK51DRAFT_50748 [Blyttiomyces helicus]|uniref:Uncharacterized protein n=1 Tax=Blyttiomyces helicus TaxID=388810 RepID=A0A4P9W0W6_9FUNG|nr:hypothetical protein BDK51DRAFT_50748 [Blyttiomyces helicus]|eukprot:RKO84328.1 hypothetical protein BDK51DRAFT_50748 [Blyttiomyces helicus]
MVPGRADAKPTNDSFPVEQSQSIKKCESVCIEEVVHLISVMDEVPGDSQVTHFAVFFFALIHFPGESHRDEFTSSVVAGSVIGPQPDAGVQLVFVRGAVGGREQAHHLPKTPRTDVEPTTDSISLSLGPHRLHGFLGARVNHMKGFLAHTFTDTPILPVRAGCFRPPQLQRTKPTTRPSRPSPTSAVPSALAPLELWRLRIRKYFDGKSIDKNLFHEPDILPGPVRAMLDN